MTAGFPALRVLLRDNVHPQPEARLPLSLHQRLGGRFDCDISPFPAGFPPVFPGSSASSPPPLLRPFFCCAAAATHPFSLLFLTIFLPVTGSSATYPPLPAVFAAIFPGFPPVFPGSSASSPVSPRCCGHFLVAPPQPPTHFRRYFPPFSYWLPVLPPLIRHFPRFLPQFSPVFRRFSLALLPVLRFPVAATVFSCAAAATKDDSAHKLTRLA